MYLTEEQKSAIRLEFTSFVDGMYAGKSKEERQRLDQFFTPAELTIQLLEALDCTYEEFLDSDIVDPTSGSVNLLAAALLIGANPNRVFGNEYDPVMVDLCRQRLKTIDPKFNDWQVHRGDATISFCLQYFGDDYKEQLKDYFYSLNYQPSKYYVNLFEMDLVEQTLTDEQIEFLKGVR